MSEPKQTKTVPRRASVFTVAPSPFNVVKFDLGVILILGALLLLLQGRITSEILIQFVVLLSYGVLGMAWIVFRARRVLLKVAAKRACDRNDSQ